MVDIEDACLFILFHAYYLSTEEYLSTFAAYSM